MPVPALDQLRARARARLGPRLRSLTARGDTPTCLVCGSRKQVERTVDYTREPSKTCVVRTCQHCGFVHMPGHIESRYAAKTDIEQLPGGHGRLGDLEVPGREFHMIKMGVDILGGSGHEALIFGAGRSMDNHHVAKLPEVDRVAISDIMKVRDDAEFIDANDPPKRKFSVVVASEVIEHFRDPHADFARLLGLVRRDGLLICGTNIHDGGKLAADRYIFYPDHTSYYSPQALRLIADRAGVHLDFRSPLVGQAMRKRYVIMSRSARAMTRVADYFGREVYAPSELARPPQPVPQRSHQSWR